MIWINDRRYPYDNHWINIKSTLEKVRREELIQSDVIIKNGFPCNLDEEISTGDRLYLLKKGSRIPKEDIKMFMRARHSPEVCEVLEGAVVGIAGLGGLGSNIAANLARIGVGKIVIADFDIVEPTNLNRQNYYIKHLGMKKVDATRDIIKEINPYIDVQGYNIFLDSDNYGEVFSQCSIIVEAFDTPKCKAELVNWTLMNTEKYIVAASGMAGYHSSNTVVTRRVSERFYLVGDGENEAKEFEGLMSPRVSIAAAHQSNCALRILMKEMEV